MAKIDAAYAYLMTTYGKTMGSRYDSHKKSELKNVYKSIVKANKDLPLYKINHIQDATSFAIDIKANSRQVQNVIASLSDNGDDISSMLQKRIAISSDDDIVSVNYVGHESDGNHPSFDIEVQKLATPQVNEGHYLNRRGHSFEEGSFSFDLDTPNNSYEFQFNVNPGDNNYDVQSKISRLINQSDVGLTAEIMMNDQGESALRISSKQTGLAEGEDSVFRIQSGASWNEVNTLGIAHITSPATNSVFLLNGTEHTSLSNTFTIDRSFELTLHQPSDGEVVHIGYKANTDTMADGINDMLQAYNGMVAIGQKYASTHGNHHLLSEVTAIAHGLSSELEDVGITADDNDMLSLDRTTLADAISGEDASTHYQTLNRFKSALSREVYRTSINPMEYVDKVIVAYKNPGRNFVAPYAPSAYAGMLVDRAL
jgi:flagellar hook-associated protein 2